MADTDKEAASTKYLADASRVRPYDDDEDDDVEQELRHATQQPASLRGGLYGQQHRGGAKASIGRAADRGALRHLSKALPVASSASVLDGGFDEPATGQQSRGGFDGDRLYPSQRAGRREATDVWGDPRT